MILFINAAFRDGSRTLRLAKHYLETCTDEIKTIELGDMDITPLNRTTLKAYNSAEKAGSFEDPMFAIAKEFAAADEIVIAAPFYNFGYPAILRSYLELACTQGINFDVREDGSYYTLCKAKKLTYITTAGGIIPEEDHAFGHIRQLAEIFWEIPDIIQYKADGIDKKENDAEEILRRVMEEMDRNK